MNLKSELELRLELVKRKCEETDNLMKISKQIGNINTHSFHLGKLNALLDEKKFLLDLIEGVLISEC